MVCISRNSVLAFASFALMLGCARWYYCWSEGGSYWSPDVFTIISVLLAAILLDIYRLKPAPSHTIQSLILQYFFVRIILTAGYFLKKRLDKNCRYCKEQQEKILKEILTQNKNTEFAKIHGITGFKSLQDFRNKMSLTTYKDYRKFVEKVEENGTPNVLFPGKADFVALTSGTTSGKSKAYPKSLKLQRRGLSWFTILQYLLFCIGKVRLLKKWFYVQIRPKEKFTTSGIKSGPISAMTYKSNYPYLVVKNFSLHTEFEALYIHLVFGLGEEDTTCFSTMVTTTALSLLTVMEKEWLSLCADIETGTLSEKLNIPDGERNRINSVLKPKPERAAFLRNEFAKGFKGILPRIWPSCPCLLAVKTGVFEAACTILQDKYLGDFPVVSLLHVGTESIYGMNINPAAQPGFDLLAFLPKNFFEFIPVGECGDSSPSTKLAHEVEVGKLYEMVVTTFDGLYRYRTEDVVKITGFYGTTPLYMFMYRAGDILSAHMEKVPEFLLQEAVVSAAAKWGRNIVEFTSCECVNVQLITGLGTSSRHYTVFIEFRDTKKLDDADIEMVDNELCERHSVYSAMRANNRLQPLELVQLKPGAFKTVKEMILASNPSAFCMQYKLPRIMRRADILKAMLDMKL